jgi:glycine cleavage system protein P-like pyridoxal-binding family
MLEIVSPARDIEFDAAGNLVQVVPQAAHGTAPAVSPLVGTHA